MKIIQSASKLVFIMMAIATIGLTFKGVLDPKDFFALTMGVFGYYFKGNGQETRPTTSNGETQ